MKILLTCLCIQLCILMGHASYCQSEFISLESDLLDMRMLQSPPTLSGNIIGYSPNIDADLQIRCSLVVPFAHTQEQKLITILDDGSFELTLDHNLPYQQIWFGIGDY